ncbi:MAG: hypothetical protein HKO01_10355 [Flaviramulus sp.]|nr:exostosin family protein [Flaviramulus sp.]NNC50926.1 hypothetical protein [Flaviramulus sp.]
MLKLYTDQTFLIESHRKTVFPLLFDLYFLEDEELLEYYILTSDISASDIVVFPIDYSLFVKFTKAFNNLRKLANKFNKPIWIYTAGDYGFTTYIKNCYTFRLGGFDNKLNSYTFIMPSFVNDPYLNVLSVGFSILKKENRPSIGFVGHAKPGFLKYLNELLNYLKYKLRRTFNLILADSQAFYPSSIKRAYLLHKLQISKSLNTNFILRNSYRAGVQNNAERKISTLEFYNNIFNNAYTFCSRGVGNFSVRFYETLATGRIPILLNTDCRLPLNDLIDWSKHIVILDESKEDSLTNQILDFHDSKTIKEFEILQKSNRELWETHLNRPSFFIQIHHEFLKKLTTHG